jgi:hypothetical protein
MTLINAVKGQFPSAKSVGCLFHFKQAIRRPMLKLRIPEDYVSHTAERLDILTVAPIKQIEKSSIAYVNTLIDPEGHAAKWTKFWRYFVKCD